MRHAKLQLQVLELLGPSSTAVGLVFYAKRNVDEVLIVDPENKSVDWFALAGEGYEPVERSALIDLGPDELARRIDWP
jgi:hypothetical protein